MNQASFFQIFLFAFLQSRVSASLYPHYNATSVEQNDTTVINLNWTIYFGGEEFTSIRIDPTMGCVALGSAALADFTSTSINERIPLICPFYSDNGMHCVNSDCNKLKYEEFDETSKVYRAIEREIRTVLEGDYKSLRQLHGLLITWRTARPEFTSDKLKGNVPPKRDTYQVVVLTMPSREIRTSSLRNRTLLLLNYESVELGLATSKSSIFHGYEAGHAFFFSRLIGLHQIPINPTLSNVSRSSRVSYEEKRKKYLYDVTVAPHGYCSLIDQSHLIASQSDGNKHLSVATVTGCKRNYFRNSNASLPLQVTCTLVDGEYIWSPREALRELCKREVLYDTSGAKTLPNPYVNVTEEDIGLKFGVKYLSIGMTKISINILRGCITLSVDNRADYAPMICPLEASHYSNPSGSDTDKFEFLYEFVDTDTAPDTIEALASDIREAGGKFDVTLSSSTAEAAYIFTWKDATYHGADCSSETLCNNQLRNTYQVAFVLLSNDKSYVIINYKSLEWSGLTNPGASPTEFSFAGFKTQDQKGYAALPYSGTADISKLLSLGTLQGLNGRYIFEVSSLPNPVRLGCYAPDAELPDLPSQTLSINTANVDIYGDNVVRIQGACLSSTDNLRCGFLARTTAGNKWSTTTVLKLDDYTGVCLTPRTPAVDVGWTSIGLSLDDGKTFNYQNEIYIGTDLNGGPLSQLDFLKDSKFWLVSQPSLAPSITFNWDSSTLGLNDDYFLDLFMVGYDTETLESTEFSIIGSESSSIGSLTIDTSVAQCSDSDCTSAIIGQAVMRVRYDELPSVLDSNDLSKTSFASILMPIGWYVHSKNVEKFGKQLWHTKYCKTADDSPWTVSSLQCPCTETLAHFDERFFARAPDCDEDDNICLYSPSAKICYITLPVNGNGLRCCYDETDQLIWSQDSPLQGSYFLPTAVESNFQVFNSSSNAQLSYHLSHVQNYYACCSAPAAQLEALPGQCFTFGYKRSVSSCSDYSPSAWTAVIGDPHFITTDGAKYTFNGLGEYWFLFSEKLDIETKIQVRFTKVVNQDQEVADATVLSAIAMEFQGSKLEIHVQPLPFRQQGEMVLMVLVDGKEYLLGEKFSEQYVGNFKIVAKYGHNSVNVRAKNNGPLIDCTYAESVQLTHDGGISCSLLLPSTYQKSFRGLAGYWDGDSSNDLLPRTNESWSSGKAVDPTDMSEVHTAFGNSWIVTADETIFTYFQYDWMYFNKEALLFWPLMEMPPTLEDDADVPFGCKVEEYREFESECIYDYVLTKNADFASAAIGDLMDIRVKKQTERSYELQCDFLDVPYTTFKFKDGHRLGSVATPTGCHPGYQSIAALPTEYICTNLSSNKATWLPTPRPYCRDTDNLFGSEEMADVIIKPDETFKKRLDAKIAETFDFGCQKINGFTVYPSHGCVALSSEKTSTMFENQTNLPLSNKDDVPMLCPLLATYATDAEDIDESGEVGDRFAVLYQEIYEPDTTLKLISYEIQELLVQSELQSSSLEISKAFIFTWSNARNEPCGTSKSCTGKKTNSYEVVLAISSKFETYAIFNYKKLEWSGIQSVTTTSAPSVVALNYGQNEGAVYLPFSGLPTESLTSLTTIGTYREVPGRFIYRVTKRFERLGCLDLPDWYLQPQPITLNTYSADVFARRRLVLQAACVPENVSQWLCAFRRSDSDSDEKAWTAQSPVYPLDQYTVVCESPRLFDADVGEWTLGLSLDAGSTWKYTQDFYLEGANSESPRVEVVDSQLWYAANITQPLSIKWPATAFSNVKASASIFLVAYKQSEDGSIIRSMDYKLGDVLTGELAFVINPSTSACSIDCEGFLIGHIAIRLNDMSDWVVGLTDYNELVSALLPIGWFVNAHEAANKGEDWYLNYCESSTVVVSQHCPCTSEVAELDNRAFLEIDNSSLPLEFQSSTKSSGRKCFTTLPLTNTGSGLLCCYDSKNNLIYSQDNPIGGSYSLQHSPFTSQIYAIPHTFTYLSYHLSHTKNVFACCSADALLLASEKCFEFAVSRSVSKSCGNYQTSGMSAIVGDPHVTTADGSLYTFNGIGEYWWVQNSENVFSIQSRFQNYLPGDNNNLINASLLTAVTLFDGHKQLQLEVPQITYSSENTKQKLVLHVNGERKTLPSKSSMRNYGGAVVRFSESGKSVRVITAFDGASVECSFNQINERELPGSLACTSSLPPNNKDKILGLIGKWDDNKENDLTSQSVDSVATKSTNPDDMTAVHQFGLTWQVQNEYSKFYYFGTDYIEVNQKSLEFIPDLVLPDSTESKIVLTNIKSSCASDAFKNRCEYDLKQTNSQTFASNTAALLSDALKIRESLETENSNFCEMLDAPYSVKVYSDGLRFDSEVTVLQCYEGFVESSKGLLPVTYTCTKNDGKMEWFPAVIENICVRTSSDTTQQPATTSTAAETSSTQLEETTTAPTTVVDLITQISTTTVLSTFESTSRKTYTSHGSTTALFTGTAELSSTTTNMLSSVENSASLSTDIGKTTSATETETTDSTAAQSSISTLTDPAAQSTSSPVSSRTNGISESITSSFSSSTILSSAASGAPNSAEDYTLYIVLGTIGGAVVLASVSVCFYLFYLRPKLTKVRPNYQSDKFGSHMSKPSTVIQVESIDSKPPDVEYNDDTLSYKVES